MSEHQNIIMEIQKCPATRMYYQRWDEGEKQASKRGWVWKSCPAGGGLLKLKSTRMLYK
jgi:hypothetical protein